MKTNRISTQYLKNWYEWKLIGQYISSQLDYKKEKKVA